MVLRSHLKPWHSMLQWLFCVRGGAISACVFCLNVFLESLDAVWIWSLALLSLLELEFSLLSEQFSWSTWTPVLGTWRFSALE